MSARFLADADLRYRIVTGLRRIEPQIDIETAQAAALEGLSDSEVLQIAARKNRVLISHDRRTMAGTFYEFIREQWSPGLILVKQRCAAHRAIEELRVCYHLLETEEFVNRIWYIPL